VSGPARVLFATSNGTGLGHLNRAMAIARRLPTEIESSFFTLSQAAPIVAGEGYPVDYLASYRRPASGTDRAWNLRLRALLEALVREGRPDLVVFDGVHPYRALTHVLSAHGAPRSIWCRRPMWREGSAGAPLRRAGAFDAVLEPGELAAAADRGPTVEQRDGALRVAPIVLLDRSELLPRREAAGQLGLDPDRRTALVTLGQGGEVDAAVARTLRTLVAVPDLQVAALESSIAGGLVVPDGVIRLEATYPMSRYLRAFDLAVAAAGYNAFHELIAFAVPTLFVPMTRDTDDQAGRASWAAGEGVALALEGAGDRALEERAEELVAAGTAERLRARCEELATGNGATAAAGLVARMARGVDAMAPGVRDRGRLQRWLRLSSHPLGPTLPLVAALGARDLARHPERRRPQLAILALEVPADELLSRIETETAAAGVEAERTLVLTDSLDFAGLRRLGVAFEHLPGPAGGTEMEGPRLELLRERIRLLLRGRAPRQAVSVGRLGTELLGLPKPDEPLPEPS